MAGSVKIVLASLLFSLNPLLFRSVDLDPVSLLWCVNLAASLGLLAKITLEGRVSGLVRFRKAWGALLALGVFAVVNNTFFILSIKKTTIANAMFTHYMAPVFVAVLGIFVLKEGVTKATLVSLGISLLGLGVLLSPNRLSLENAHFTGLLFGALSAVFFALEILMKKVLTNYHDADLIVVRYLFLSLLLMLPYVSFPEIRAVTVPEIMILLFCGLITSALGITLFLSGLRTVKAQEAGIIGYTEPLGAIAWAILFTTETLTTETLLGGILVIFGTYLTIRSGEPSSPSYQTRYRIRERTFR
jgi:drug/metabolite transporter (DMT)-like permease